MRQKLAVPTEIVTSARMNCAAVGLDQLCRRVAQNLPSISWDLFPPQIPNDTSAGASQDKTAVQLVPTGAAHTCLVARFTR
jgi:hypothetical protein